MAYYQIGKEPDSLKRRIKTLFEKLDSAYPDKNIVGLHTEHKKWGETLTKLYRELGYSSGKDFLEAYGYTYGNKEAKAGRPKTVDSKAIIKELQDKYPNGSPFKTADELFAGTEYESKLKTIKNTANSEFGMSLGKYLLSIGLIQPREALNSEEDKKGQCGMDSRDNVNTTKTIIRRVGVREYNKATKNLANAENSDDKKTNTASALNTSDRIQLSADGKTVTGYKAKAKKEREAIHIPSGVETIEDRAFQRVDIEKLFIPKELKTIGKYTLHDTSPHDADDVYPKYIDSITVEEGNKNYYVDEIGFYSIQDGMKTLELVLDREITEYVCPKDVNFLSPGCFEYCSNLKILTLSNSVEKFDENCLSNHTLVKNVYIPKTVKKLHAKGINNYFQTWNTVTYTIDEESEYLFKDEDSIYEVLDDGTYKLVKNQYEGKGRVLILEGTSIIGEHAFKGHQNFTDIEFPKSLRIIESKAFSDTALKSVEIPDYVNRIEAKAFLACRELESVQLPSNLEYVAENAFNGCWKLREIKSECEKQAFLLEEGNIIRLISATGEEIRRDFFDEFGKRIVQKYREYGATNCVSYDESKRVVNITESVDQYSPGNEKLLEERIACAENLSVGSPVIIKPKSVNCEVRSMEGKSLGAVGSILVEVAKTYGKYISIGQGSVVEITPKSKRRANAKYAKCTIKFEILEKRQ